MEKMIDIHAHILPGIDDGAADIGEALHMARMAADSGVTAIAATPHCNIPGSNGNYAGREYRELFRRVAGAAEQAEIPIQILPGAEVFATWDLPELLRDGKILTLNGSRYLLVEFAFDEDPGFAGDVLDRIGAMNLVPVIAHAERYEFVREIPGILQEWREKRYPIQVNKGSFHGRFGRRARAAAEYMMKERLVSVIASDAHGSYQRTPCMKDTYQMLQENYPEKYLQVIFEENPRRILKNQKLIRCMPKQKLQERTGGRECEVFQRA